MLKFPPLRPIVFWLPLILFALLVGTSLVMPQSFLVATTVMNDWILVTFSNAFAIAAFIFVLTSVWAAVSPLGKVRIGGADAKPLLPRWNWLAITLTTTIAIGILFWATAEPLYHLYAPGRDDIAPGSEAAVRFSMVSLYMHWSFTPYAIYTVASLTFAIAFYNFKQPFSLAAPISVVIGRAVPKRAASVLDGLALLALLFGLSASLGSGILSISGGIDRLTPLSSGPWLLGFVAITIVAAFFLSSASGLQNGIRVLSDINTKIFLGLLIFVFLFGPTVEIITLAVKSFGQYVVEFVPRSLVLEPFNERDWVNAWTVFYFANWLAWAPLASMFLGRIARGYTVREFVLVNFLLPALFSVLWMSIFGGIALSFEQTNPSSLNSVLENKGPEHVLYAITDQLPLAVPLAAIMVIVSFISYVTAADSNTQVLANLSVKGRAESQQEPGKNPKYIKIKFIWAVSVGLAAWVMTTMSGIDGIKMLSNLGGLPALFIVGAFNVALILFGTIRLKGLRADRYLLAPGTQSTSASP